MIYGPTDVRHVLIPDGCGVAHERAATGDQFVIDCPSCERAGTRQFAVLGFANHTGGVRLTCDEKAQAKRDEEQAQRAGWRNLAGQIATAASGAPQAPDMAAIMERLSALEGQASRVADLEAENAALRARLAAQAPVQIDETTRPPVPAKRTRKVADKVVAV